MKGLVRVGLLVMVTTGVGIVGIAAPMTRAATVPLIPIKPHTVVNGGMCVVGRPCAWKPSDGSPGALVTVWNLGHTKGNMTIPPGPRATMVEIGKMVCGEGPCGNILIVQFLLNYWAVEISENISGVYQASPTLFLVSASSCYMRCSIHVWALDTSPAPPKLSTVTSLLNNDKVSIKDGVCGVLMTFKGRHFTAIAHKSTKYIASVALVAGAHSCQ